MESAGLALWSCLDDSLYSYGHSIFPCLEESRCAGCEIRPYYVWDTTSTQCLVVSTVLRPGKARLGFCGNNCLTYLHRRDDRSFLEGESSRWRFDASICDLGVVRFLSEFYSLATQLIGDMLQSSYMQKISTRVFICASIAFGVVGLGLVLFGGPNDNAPVNQVFMRLLMACVFVILPSFALSIASKYLDSR